MAWLQARGLLRHTMPSPMAAAAAGRGKRGFGIPLPAQVDAGGIMKLPER